MLLAERKLFCPASICTVTHFSLSNVLVLDADLPVPMWILDILCLSEKVCWTQPVPSGFICLHPAEGCLYFHHLSMPEDSQGRNQECVAAQVGEERGVHPDERAGWQAWKR